KYNFFGCATAQQALDFAQQFGFGHQVTIFQWHLQGITQCADATWYNGNLLHPVGPRCEIAHDGMAGFVVSNNLLFFWADDATLAFQAGYDPLDGSFKVALHDGIMSVTHGDDG